MLLFTTLLCCCVWCYMYLLGYRLARPGEEVCRAACPVQSQLEMVLMGTKPQIRIPQVQQLKDLMAAFDVNYPNRDLQDLNAFLTTVQTSD